MAKHDLLVFLVHTEDREHLRLQVRLVNPDAAAADLDAVEDDVVGLGAHFAVAFFFEQREVVGVRAGERMMDRVPLVFRGVELQEREIGDPEEIELLRVFRQALDFGDAQTKATEHFAGDLPFIGAEENEVAFLDCEPGLERVLLGLGKEFHDRRFPFAVFDLDEGESLCAKVFRNRRHLVHLADGDTGEAFCVDRLHDPAALDHAAEHLETALAKLVGEIDQLHAETAVGLVASVGADRFAIGHARERRRDVDLARGLERSRPAFPPSECKCHPA